MIGRYGYFAGAAGAVRAGCGGGSRAKPDPVGRDRRGRARLECRATQSGREISARPRSAAMASKATRTVRSGKGA